MSVQFQVWREVLRHSRQATVRDEMPPGKPLNADFGELWVPTGGVRSEVQMCVLTMGYSRRHMIRNDRHQRQRHWLQLLEEAFRCGLAGRRLDTWGPMESHPEWWNRESLTSASTAPRVNDRWIALSLQRQIRCWR
ncbi:MAG: hypothetical protein VKM34_10920 [Cyanobacteriota bacterium]|nr:hypothetical protein [Cyanobacteriota bacterium]